MAGKSATAIRVGANGTVYVAPSGTSLPTDITSAWTGFTDVGYCDEGGAVLSRSMDTEVIRAWQSVSVLRYLITGVSLTAAFTLLQWDKDTIPFYFGGGSITTQAASKYKYDISSAPTIDERAFGIEWTDGATITYRFLIGRGMVQETGESNVQRSDGIKLPMTFGAMTPASGTVLGTILTNDPAFA
jgi:hypothetical protein